MTHQVIPAEAIEAAKEAMCEVTPPPGVSKADWLAEHGDFALIAGAIAAAAPYIWDEGAEAEFDRGKFDPIPINPYGIQP